MFELDRTFGVILSNPLYRSSIPQMTGCDLSKATQRQQRSQCRNPGLLGIPARTGRLLGSAGEQSLWPCPPVRGVCPLM